MDVIELASRYKRFSGMQIFLASFFKLKNIRSRIPRLSEVTNSTEISKMMRDCDMARIDQSPLWSAIVLKNILPRGRILIQRQINFSSYATYFSKVPGAKPLFPINSETIALTAPYVFPLWVDDPDSIYQALRALKLPVFRWDRIWPNTPNLPGDAGTLWSHHVLQLLCHQDLSSEDIDRTAQAVLNLLQIQQAELHAVNR